MRPLKLAGEISDIYMGATTEEAPTPMPPIRRKKTKRDQLLVMALPIAETAKSTAMINNTGFLPNLSAGIPANNEPATVPINAEEIVKP